MERKYDARKAMLLMGAAMLSPGAWAVPPTELMVTQTETVKFARASAETPQGAVKLYGALQAAASRTCRDPSPQFMMSAVSVACADAALARAVGDVNIAAVSAIYLQNAKRPANKGVVTVAKR